MEWLSAHLFLARSAEQQREDRVISDVLSPFAQTCLRNGEITRCFFIRYRERGPHVRLRMLGESEVLRRTVSPALANHVAEHLSAQDAGVPDIPTIGIVSADELSGVEPLRWIRYEPETDRYGGAEALPLAEQLFHVSSQAAFALLPAIISEGPDARLGVAMTAMLAVMGAAGIGATQAGEVARRHRDRWMVFNPAADGRLLARYDYGKTRNGDGLAAVVRDVWSASSEDPYLLPEPFNACVEQMRPLMDELRALVQCGRVRVRGETLLTWRSAVLQLLPDYMHMSNNRLGVAPHLEAYLAHLIEDALGAAGHAVAG
jgi:thiopeptide-type bacteriocin biosynthesis protein